MHRTTLRPVVALVAVLAVLLAGCGPTTAALHGSGTTGGGTVGANDPAPSARTAAARRAPVPVRAPVRTIHAPEWSPFATVSGITLVHPSAVVERIGFHQSNHDGARQLDVQPTASGAFTLESRDRETGSRTAADIVVAPDLPVRSVVTGTVVRAGTYVLYCEHADDFAVIEPDAHPGWEAKMLHIDGVRVSPGDRVEAGVTVLADGPTPLPFASQVDEHTADPSWPHVHVEVVDPSIPDRPSPGGGC